MENQNKLTTTDIQFDDVATPKYKEQILNFIYETIAQQTEKIDFTSTPTTQPQDEAYKELYFVKQGFIILSQIFEAWDESDLTIIEFIFEQKKFLMFMTKRDSYDMRYNTKEAVESQLFIQQYTLKALKETEKWCVHKGFITHVNPVTPKMYKVYRDKNRLAFIAQQKANFEQMKRTFGIDS